MSTEAKEFTLEVPFLSFMANPGSLLNPGSNRQANDDQTEQHGMSLETRELDEEELSLREKGGSVKNEGSSYPPWRNRPDVHQDDDPHAISVSLKKKGSENLL